MTFPLCDNDNQYFTVYTSRLAEIWNSDAMREIRRAMVAGEPVPACAHYCMAIEAVDGLSRRLGQNRSWETGRFAKEGVSIDDLKADAVRNNFYVEYAPFHMAIEVDNKCNLACRICSADRSSRVENDPVHSRWAGRLQCLPRWEDNTLELGPSHLISGTYEGFNIVDDLQKVKTLWTTARAEICLPGVHAFLESLEIRLSPESTGKLKSISVNGAVKYSRTADQPFSQNITVGLNSHITDLCLGFESEAGYSAHFNAPVGIGLERVAIKRNGTIRPVTQLLRNRFPGKKHWMEADEFLFKELFPKGTQQQGLHIVGGEPLINKNVLRIIKHLAKTGNLKNQRVSFATNGTVFNKKVFKQAKKFKRMIIAFSIDAIGKSHEYIRYSARWNVLQDNLKRMMSVKNVNLFVSNTFLAYNALEILDVFRFCDQLKLRCFSTALNFPPHLSVDVLPVEVREKAVQRLRVYTGEEDHLVSHNRNTAVKLINTLESPERPFSPQKLHRFMLFTNDLDSSRGQDIKKTFPELVQLLEKAGYPWIDEHFYFSVGQN